MADFSLLHDASHYDPDELQLHAAAGAPVVPLAPPFHLPPSSPDHPPFSSHRLPPLSSSFAIPSLPLSSLPLHAPHTPSPPSHAAYPSDSSSSFSPSSSSFSSSSHSSSSSSPPPLSSSSFSSSSPSPDFLTAWIDPSPNLFHTLPHHSIAGAFLPLRPSVSSNLRSNEHWAVFDYGETSDTPIAFCLHPACKHERATNPKAGLFVPAVYSSMNRHSRDKHKLFDAVVQKEGGKGGGGTGGQGSEGGGKVVRRKVKKEEARTQMDDDKEEERNSASSDSSRQGGGKRRKRKRTSSQPRRTFVASSTLKVSPSHRATSPTASSHASTPERAGEWTASSSAVSTPSARGVSSSTGSAASSTPSSSPPSNPPLPVLPAHFRQPSTPLPYTLFVRLLETFSFFASFVRLQWDSIAAKVSQLTAMNAMGSLLCQTHIINLHRHTVTFQTAAGIITDNDGECPCHTNQVEKITRARYTYECIVRCAECNSDSSWAMKVGRHYRLTDALELLPMTDEEEKAHMQRDGYVIPFLPDCIPVNPGAHRTLRQIMQGDGTVPAPELMPASPVYSQEVQYSQQYGVYRGQGYVGADHASGGGGFGGGGYAVSGMAFGGGCGAGLAGEEGVGETGYVRYEEEMGGSGGGHGEDGVGDVAYPAFTYEPFALPLRAHSQFLHHSKHAPALLPTPAPAWG